MPGKRKAWLGTALVVVVLGAGVGAALWWWSRPVPVPERDYVAEFAAILDEHFPVDPAEAEAALAALSKVDKRRYAMTREIEQRVAAEFGIAADDCSAHLPIHADGADPYIPGEEKLTQKEIERVRTARLQAGHLVLEAYIASDIPEIITGALEHDLRMRVAPERPLAESPEFGISDPNSLMYYELMRFLEMNRRGDERLAMQAFANTVRLQHLCSADASLQALLYHRTPARRLILAVDHALRERDFSEAMARTMLDEVRSRWVSALTPQECLEGQRLIELSTIDRVYRQESDSDHSRRHAMERDLTNWLYDVYAQIASTPAHERELWRDSLSIIDELPEGTTTRYEALDLMGPLNSFEEA